MLIVFIGIDGTGTTTQSQELVKRLREDLSIDTAIHWNREPTPSPIGTFVRKVLAGKVPETKRMPAESFNRMMAYLCMADRELHSFGDDGLARCLGVGNIVVSDRYWFCTHAYNGTGFSDDSIIWELNQKFPEPDMVFFLDMPAKDSLARKEGTEREIYEKIEFLEDVRDRYYDILSLYKYLMQGKCNVVDIDASLPEAEISEHIYQEVKKELEKCNNKNI